MLIESFLGSQTCRHFMYRLSRKIDHKLIEMTVRTCQSGEHEKESQLKSDIEVQSVEN